MSARPSHEIQLLDYSGRVKRRFFVRSLDGMSYDRVNNDVGSFALDLVGKQAQWVIDNAQLPGAKDYFVDVLRLDPVTGERRRDHTYLYQYLEFGRQQEDDTVFATLGGYCLNWLLMTRLVDVRHDPLEAGGFLTLSGPASDVMARLVRYNGGAATALLERAWPIFDVRSDGMGHLSGGDYRFDVLLDALQTLALAGNVQFSISFDGRGLVFNVGHTYEDRTVERNYPGRVYTLVSRRRGNLDNPVIVQDFREVQNVAYARGSGSAGNEIFFVQAGERSENSPYGRVEFEYTINRRAGESAGPEALISEVNAALRERAPVMGFEFEATDRQGLRYGYDWDLGWLLTGEYAGVRRNVRVSGVETTVDASGAQVIPVLEDAGDLF